MDNLGVSQAGLQGIGMDSDSDSEVVDLDIIDDGYESSATDVLLDGFADYCVGIENSRDGFEWEELDRVINESGNLIRETEIDDELLSRTWSSISALSEGVGDNTMEDSISSLERDLLYAIDTDDNSFDYSFDIDSGYAAFLDQLVDNETDCWGNPPAAKRVLENLPLVDLRKADLDSMVCAICKDQILEGARVNKLPCSHYYHNDCIVPWLKMRNSCPVCRYELPTDDKDYESRSSRRRRLH